MVVLSDPINPENRDSTVRISSCFGLGGLFAADLSHYASQCMQSGILIFVDS